MLELTRRQILASGIALAASSRVSTLAAQKDRALYRISVEEARNNLALLEPLHEAKKTPAPGDWLKSHREDGQTFAQFLKAKTRRSCDVYERLYLQPLGKFTADEEKVLAATADCMQRFFGMPVTTNKTLSLDTLPATARRVHPAWDVPQVLSTYLLDKVLKPRCPRDAAAMLALTASDLWPGQGWNFVFGQASLVDRVGVWSIYRNGKVDGTDDERRMFLRRTLKTALHETGHMYGIPHCTAYECGMNGSNHREESDRQPLEFCPQCQAKIWWTCGIHPRERCERLLAYGKEHKLTEEAAFWEQSLMKLKT